MLKVIHLKSNNHYGQLSNLQFDPVKHVANDAVSTWKYVNSIHVKRYALYLSILT